MFLRIKNVFVFKQRLTVTIFIPSHTLFLWTIPWTLSYRNDDLLISWSYLLILSFDHISWSYIFISNNIEVSHLLILSALKPLNNTWPLPVKHSLGSPFKDPDAEPTVTITTVKSELFEVVTLATVTRYLAIVYIKWNMHVSHGQSMFNMCLVKKWKYDA